MNSHELAWAKCIATSITFHKKGQSLMVLPYFLVSYKCMKSLSMSPQNHSVLLQCSFQCVTWFRTSSGPQVHKTPICRMELSLDCSVHVCLCINPPKGGIISYVVSWLTVINIWLTGSHSCRYLDTGVTFYLFSVHQWLALLQSQKIDNMVN